MADMGRKGSAGTVPVRVAYEPPDGHGDGPVVLAPPEGVDVPWRAVGAGWDVSGTLKLTAARGWRQPDAVREVSTLDRLPGDLPSDMVVALSSWKATSARLRELAEDGAQAHWESLQEFRAMTRTYIWRARAKILGFVERGEMVLPWQDRGREARRQWLTTRDIDTLADQVVYGAADVQGRAERLLERLLVPTTFERVDPLRYVTKSLSCSAGQAVSRHLGDPAVGTKVRLVADKMGISPAWPPSSDDLDLVLKEYRATYPQHKLGRTRALQALRFRTQWDLEAAVDGSVDVAGTALGVVSASQKIDDITSRCRSVGGDSLAAVAKRWLWAIARGDVSHDAGSIARDLGMGVEEVEGQIGRVRVIALAALEKDGARLDLSA